MGRERREREEREKQRGERERERARKRESERGERAKESKRESLKSLTGYYIYFLNSFHLNSIYLGLSTPVGDCNPGFYCPGGNDVPNPVETPCPIGLHCPGGSGQPKPCDPGTFVNFTQADSCLECPAGFYCVPEEVIQGKLIMQ